MSLIGPLLRFIDPIVHRQRQAERRPRDARPDQPDPETSVEAPPRQARPDPRRRCRVCGHIDVSDYCLLCLADTMEDLP